MEQHQVESAVKAGIDMHHQEPNGNCAQSAACALCRFVGVDADEAFRSMEGFGGGMGGFDQTCGAISGAVYVLSRSSSAGVDVRGSKDATYALCSGLVSDFRKEFGSTLCGDLRDPDPARRKQGCDGYIARAIELAAARL